MNFFTKLGGLLLVGLLNVDSSDVHWGYEGPTGPDNWGSLDASYRSCSKGLRQSPISLNKDGHGLRIASNTFMAPWKDIKGQLEYKNNGHAIGVDLSKLKENFKLNCQDFELKQFHIHTPSEHIVDGKKTDLELHFVYTDPKEAQYRVFGILFKADVKASIDKGFLSGLAHTNGTLNSPMSKLKIPKLDLGKLFNSVNQFKTGYRYSGSLTTPPCTETAHFVISDRIQTVHPSIIDQLLKATGPNARPIQATSGSHENVNELIISCPVKPTYPTGIDPKPTPINCSKKA